MSIVISDAAQAQLDAIAADAVSRTSAARVFPDVDIRRAVALLDDSRRQKLSAVGYDISQLEVMSELGSIYRQAMMKVDTSRSTDAPRDSAALLADARSLRDLLVRACRYHLGEVAGMTVRLDALRYDTGALDLSVDLDVLAEIMEQNAGLFAADTTLDVAARVAEAHALANQIRDMVAMDDGRPDGAEHRDLRDRAALAFARNISRLRAAVAYAFPDDLTLQQALRERVG